MVAPVNDFDAALRQFQNGHLVEAQRRLENIVPIEPENAEAWHLLGLIEFQKSNFTDAVKLFRRAVQIEIGRAHV